MFCFGNHFGVWSNFHKNVVTSFLLSFFLCRRACGIEVDDSGSQEQAEEPAHAPPVEKLVQDSGKMVFLVNLMENLRKEKHRTIIFSQSRKMLDIIQKTLLSTVSLILG